MLSFRLDRFPVRVERSEYDDVAAVIEDRLKGTPGLIALYALGGLSAPGISDLDRIAVVDRKVGPVSSGWESLLPRERYITMHSPFLVDAESFRVHQWFAHLSPLTCLWGEPLTVDPPPVDAGIPSRLGIEHLVMMRVRLEKVLFLGRIAVRPMLCELHNLRHDLRLAGIPEEVAPAAWAVVREVEILRSRWWELGKAEQVNRMRRLPLFAAHGIDEALATSGRVVPVETGPQSIRLHGHWGKVSLQSASVGEPLHHSPTVPRAVAQRSRRGGELRWRLASHRIPMPDAVVALLAKQSAEELGVLAIRREHFTRYSAFMSSRSGWSSIGVVGSLYG